MRGLRLDAYLVGGAVRDEQLGVESKDADFVVPGVDYDGLRSALEPHGGVEDLEVGGRRVGARLYPTDPRVRSLAPAGIEFAPPRAERSTGPGRHDFEIVVDPGLSIEDDMERRDFTVNAMAKRLETVSSSTRSAERPISRTACCGRFDLAASPRIPCASCAGFGSSRSSASNRRKRRCSRCVTKLRVCAPSLRSESAEACRPTVSASSRSCCSAASPPRRCGSRATRACSQRSCPSSSLQSDSNRTASASTFLSTSTSSRSCRPLPMPATIFAVRLGALFHDLGKPGANGSHATRGADLTAKALRRLRYPRDCRRT